MDKMATGIAVLTIAIFIIFSCLLVFPTKLDIPVEEFRAEDLGFYSSSQIIAKVHRDLVLNTIAPNLDVNKHRHFYDQQTFSKWIITSHLVSNDQNNKQSILRILILCGDISLNPGPPRYPCAKCEQSVRSNQKGIQCAFCDVWFINVSNELYNKLSISTES